MNQATRGTLPTLTEVIEVAATDTAATEPLPLAPESVALDKAPAAPPPPAPGVPRLALLGAEEAARIVDAVVARLQPRIETWVREQATGALREAVHDALQKALQQAVQERVDAVAADVARRLRDELPALAREALAQVRPPGSFES